jgi:trans-aconitate methyltransferase
VFPHLSAAFADSHTHPLSGGLNGYQEFSFGSNYREEVGTSRSFAALEIYGAKQPSRCHVERVCDIGCGTGLQVLVGALLNPQIQFLGIDGSESHIADARRTCEKIGLANARFELVDLCDAPDHSNKFDLITCAGTFSWVPVDVQAHIFQFIAKNLSEQGAAIIHYLTLPGANVEQRLQRDLAQHVNHLPTLQARLASAKTYLAEQIAGVETLTADESPDVRTRVARRLFDPDDRGVPHEFLASPISAYYFRDFATQARSHGFNVIGDAAIPSAEPMSLPAGPITDLFDRAKNWEEQQEILDMFGGGSCGRYALLSRFPRAATPQLDSLNHAFFRLSDSDWYVIENDRVHVRESQSLPVPSAVCAGLMRLHAAFPATLAKSDAFPAVDVKALWPLVALGVVNVFSHHVAAQSREIGKRRTFDMARVECELEHANLTSFIGLTRPRHPLIASILLYAAQPKSEAALVEYTKEGIKRMDGGAFAAQVWRRWWPSRNALNTPYGISEVSEAGESFAGQIIARLVRLGYLV